MVSGTLSFGKWHIILWEKKLIPSGNWTRGNWNTTIESYNEKSGIYILYSKAKHTNKDSCDRKSAEKNV